MSLTVAPAAETELVNRSGGVVRRPETIHYRTYEECDGGLFCPQVFGSPRGRRRRRLGHIVLESAIVPILWRLGRPCLLETLLGISTAKIEKVVLYEADVFVRESKVRMETRPVESAPELTNEGWEPLGTGAAAVAALLSRVAPERVPAGLQNRLGALTSKIVLVPPADVRPLVLLDSGNFATHDANDLIRRVVNRTNRLAKLVELKAPQVILDNEQRMLQLAVDALQANSLVLTKNAVLGSGQEKGRRLKCAMDMVQELLEPKGKRVDWCGRARVVVRRLADPESALIPATMFRKLELSESEPVLITVEGGDGRFIARWPRAADGSTLVLDERTAPELGLPSGIANCIVHRPLGQAARNEARQLMQASPPASEAAVSRGGWLEAPTPREIACGLALAAANGERVFLNSPALLALGGTGAVEFPPDPGPESPPEDYRQAMLPPDLLSS